MDNYGIFDNVMATRQIVTALVRNATVQEMPEVVEYSFPVAYITDGTELYASDVNSLTRNQHLNHVSLLLVPPPPQPPPPPQQQQQQRNAGTMTLKSYHKAITKFATVPNNAGASVIFKLFTARPQLLEKRLKRPAALAAAVAAATTTTTITTVVSQQQKR
jgi:hypothetical protein